MRSVNPEGDKSVRFLLLCAAGLRRTRSSGMEEFKYRETSPLPGNPSRATSSPAVTRPALKKFLLISGLSMPV